MDILLQFHCRNFKTSAGFGVTFDHRLQDAVETIDACQGLLTVTDGVGATKILEVPYYTKDQA